MSMDLFDNHTRLATLGKSFLHSRRLLDLAQNSPQKTRGDEKNDKHRRRRNLSHKRDTNLDCLSPTHSQLQVRSTKPNLNLSLSFGGSPMIEDKHQKKLDRQKRWRDAHKDHLRKYNQNYFRTHRERARGYYRTYYRVHKDEKNSRIRSYYEKYPERLKAHRLANYYCILEKQCSICGSKDNLERHHPDYSKPLSVVTLCRPCHEKIHDPFSIEG